MSELAQQELPGDKPEDIALFLYNAYLPEFKKTIKKLSSRARARVMNALMEYPLNEGKYVHSTIDEKKAMAIGHSVLEAKFLLVMSQYNVAIDNLTMNELHDKIEELENDSGPSLEEGGQADDGSTKG